MKISKKVAGVEYAIRDIVSAAREIELQGKTVDYLNIGDPVQCGFQPPQNVKQAMIDAINNGNNFYTRSEGLTELTEAIAKKENAKGLSISSENILVTNGVSEGLDMVISSIVEEGDEVLLPGPYYPPYASYVRLHEGIPIEFFGQNAMTTSVPAELAIRFKIPLVPARVERVGGAHFRLTVFPPLALPDSGDSESDARVVTARASSLFEGWIRERPEQWLWLHRRWPGRL